MSSSAGLASSCAPVAPLRSRKRLCAGILAILTIGCALWMAPSIKAYPFAHDFHDEIDSPVLALELSSEAADVRSVLGTDHPLDETGKAPLCAIAVLRANTYKDCLFILLYSSFLWCFGTLFAQGAEKFVRMLGFITIATALADYAENIGIIRTLRTQQVSDSLASSIYWPSRGKWMLFAGTLLLISVILIVSRNVVYSLASRRLAGIAYAVTGGLIFGGQRRPNLIELGIYLFAILLLTNAIALLGPYITELAPPTVPEYSNDYCQQRTQERSARLQAESKRS